jgi:phosphate starvation-inducible protein PhoH and related proteins
MRELQTTREHPFLSRKARRSWAEHFTNDNQRQRRNNDNTINLQDHKRYNKRIELLPRNLRQEDYIANLQDPEKSIVFATGPAGTGKTMLAVLAGVKLLKEGEITKIVITRPAVGVEGEKHGFLPGDLNQKMEPWTRPIFDVLHEHYSPRETARMLDEQILEISPLAFMRGRTFKEAWIIADEMQNATPSQMKMLLTRLGEGSRMVVTGDVMQADRKEGENGLLDFDKLLRNTPSDLIAWTAFDHKDIERHPAVREVLRIYGDLI